MKKTLLPLSAAIALSINATSVSAITLTFTTNDESDNSIFPSTEIGFDASFGSLQGEANPDFRVMMAPDILGGGGEKAMSNGVSWNFSDTNNYLTSVTGSDITAGAATYQTNAGDSSAAPDGGVGLFKNTAFNSAPMGFLAPTLGSAAGNAYGAASISGDTSGNGIFEIFLPVLEMQWVNAPHTLGKSNGGVTFNCTSTAGNFECFSETRLALADDSLGFTGAYFQFNVTGTISAVPVPAAVWLFGSGLIGLIGVAKRKRVS